MEQKLRTYANVLLKTCLKIEKKQPLFIKAENERMDFVRIVTEEAYKLGVKDIYYDVEDSYLKHEALKNLTIDELKKTTFWNMDAWNEYAKKGAAFLMLASELPGLMDDIDPEKINTMTIHGYKTREYFEKCRASCSLSWCIAAVPTKSWAKVVFPSSKDPVADLWEQIFKICAINKKNPLKFWPEKINRLKKIAKKLNAYQFKTLVYKNALGTDFTIELPENAIWASGSEKLTNGKEVLVNFPTEEIFTSPERNSASGIVYSAKPLVYQGNVIDDFYITFEKGRVVSCRAKKGGYALRKLISSCPNCDRLGEVALVERSSSIATSNLVFYETLFDENAACHLALGESFSECIKNGSSMTKEELIKEGLNQCDNHVDFMIGTKDLSIIGITKEGKQIPIFEKGNFSSIFK